MQNHYYKLQETMGYGCISVMKKEIDVTKTKAFEALRNLFLPEENIVIEKINARMRQRPVLEQLTASREVKTLVITSIYTLGRDIIEIKKNYIQIFYSGKALLIPNYNNADALDKFSTADFTFHFRYNKEKIDQLIQELDTLDIPDPQTLRAKGCLQKSVDEDFKTAYWLFESYQMKEAACYAKANVAKGTFHRLADKYETSPEYEKDEQQQYELLTQKGIHLEQLPKHHGTVPDCVTKIESLLLTGMDFQQAKAKCNANLTPLTYKRFLVKRDGGRGAMRAALFQNCKDL